MARVFNSSLHTKHFKNSAQKCLLETEVLNLNYLQDTAAQHRDLQCCRTAYIMLIFRPWTQKYLGAVYLSQNVIIRKLCQEQDQTRGLLLRKCSFEATCSFLMYNRIRKRIIFWGFFVKNMNDLVEVYLLVRDLA